MMIMMKCIPSSHSRPGQDPPEHEQLERGDCDERRSDDPQVDLPRQPRSEGSRRHLKDHRPGSR